MGKHSRNKGRSFEQLVADAYRKAWPKSTVRRSLQAHRPYEPDVVVEGPQVGHKLWTECNHADDPHPLDKLAQAERDIAEAQKHDKPFALPIVVWRKSGARTINLTTRLWVLSVCAAVPCVLGDWQQTIVTMDFAEWLKLLAKLDNQA